MRKENVMSARALFLAGFGAVCLTANPAHADAIDGTWCGPDGGTLSIDGPRIVTPGHARLTGEYTRHAFRYEAPAREPDAGTQVTLLLLDEDTVRLERTGGSEIWRRCDVIS
jgi:hypothetical protein